jgi:hypothetical protein
MDDVPGAYVLPGTCARTEPADTVAAANAAQIVRYLIMISTPKVAKPL